MPQPSFICCIQFDMAMNTIAVVTIRNHRQAFPPFPPPNRDVFWERFRVGAIEFVIHNIAPTIIISRAHKAAFLKLISFTQSYPCIGHFDFECHVMVCIWCFVAINVDWSGRAISIDQPSLYRRLALMLGIPGGLFKGDILHIVLIQYNLIVNVFLKGRPMSKYICFYFQRDGCWGLTQTVSVIGYG